MKIKDQELCTAENLQGLYTSNVDLSDINQGKISRVVFTNELIDWLIKFANWKISLTLTFRENQYPDVAKRKLLRMIQGLNLNLIGKNYTKIVGHSYFSYAYGIEYQKRECIHFHMLVDEPVNFRLLHSWLWRYNNGFCWTDIIRNREDCVEYISKYNFKGGEIEFYKNNKYYVPKIRPDWWVDENIKGSFWSCPCC